MNKTNPASDLLDQIYLQQVQADKQYAPGLPSVQPAEPDPEVQAEVSRQAANASAWRGLVFGVPLAILMWSIPTAAWLATGSTWVGLATGVAEFVVAGWIVWAQRSPAQPRRTRSQRDAAR